MTSTDPLEEIRCLRTAIQADRTANQEQWQRVELALATVSIEERRAVARTEARGAWLLVGATAIQSAMVLAALFVATGSHDLAGLPRAIAIGGGTFSVIAFGLLVALRRVLGELERMIDVSFEFRRAGVRGRARPDEVDDEPRPVATRRVRRR